MEHKEHRIIKFQDIKNDIIAQLKIHGQKTGITEPVTLVDGFIRQPYNMELSSTFVIGGPTIPMIMLLGDETGQIYLFALKAILKNLEL
jgi:hypothetical protein